MWGDVQFDFTSNSFRTHFDFTSKSLRFHIDFTSSSLRFHFDSTLISIRLHFDFTSDSLRVHFAFTSNSLRLSFDLTSILHGENGNRPATQGERENSAGPNGKGKTPAPHLSSNSTWQPYHAHARTKRNDFLVGVTPQPPIHKTGGLTCQCRTKCLRDQACIPCKPHTALAMM